jgi:cellulose biosynthesis protein BcsQ
MFLGEDRLEQLWPENEHTNTVLGAVNPILRGTGDVRAPHVEEITEHLGLIVGDLGLSRFEAKLSDAWPKCVDEDESAFRTVSSFYRALLLATQNVDADVVLIDVGPNLGAINRCAILAADFLAVPVAADLYSLQGLRNLGPTLREWRKQWEDRLARRPRSADLQLPGGRMEPVGYIILQHAVRLDRPVKAYQRWMKRIPEVYHAEIVDSPISDSLPAEGDPHCLASLKHYRSLMPLAQDALKPMFHLKAADGALGAHLDAVRSCYDDFKRLAQVLWLRCGLDPAIVAAE